MEEEAFIRLKSIVVWISLGNNNTRFFHYFASNKKNLNSIWELVDENGNLVKGQDQLQNLAKNCFDRIFKRGGQTSLEAQLKTIKYYLAFFVEEDKILMENQLTLKEVQEALK